MEGIQIFERQVGFNNDIFYLKVNGFIDTSTSYELVNKIKAIYKKNYVQFVIDMSGVNYVSSAGWGVFVGEIKNIRENGGDLKLVNMTPEVYDVFEMLEFNKILKTNDAVEEAVNEFDLQRGFDITESPVNELQNEHEAVQAIPDIQVLPKSTEKKETEDVTDRDWSKKTIDPKFLPLPEKIKLLVSKNPLLNIWGIKKQLASEKFGKTKINIVKLYVLLRGLNLSKKDERYRYYRSR